MSLQDQIHQKLTQAFKPKFLEVVNESHMHNVPPGSESHFKVTLVSEQFTGQRLVKRHQSVYSVLADELKNGVHALALHTSSSDEWRGVSPNSPNCLGGSKSS